MAYGAYQSHSCHGASGLTRARHRPLVAAGCDRRRGGRWPAPRRTVTRRTRSLRLGQMRAGIRVFRPDCRQGDPHCSETMRACGRCKSQSRRMPTAGLEPACWPRWRNALARFELPSTPAPRPSPHPTARDKRVQKRWRIVALLGLNALK